MPIAPEMEYRRHEQTTAMNADHPGRNLNYTEENKTAHDAALTPATQWLLKTHYLHLATSFILQ